MKTISRILGVLLAIILAFQGYGYAANMESFGMISAGVGAERETGGPSGCTNLATAQQIFSNTDVFKPHACAGQPGARGMASVLGVMPFAMQDLGLQLGANYNGGDGSRFGATLGPVFGWTGGKAGVILDYRFRTHGNSHFFWLTPAVSIYSGDLNFNLSYTQQMSSIQIKTKFLPNAESPSEVSNRWETRYVPYNRLQGSVSYFPMNSMELNVGLQVNTFAGQTKDIRSAGVGPVFAVAWMPINNIQLNLVKGTFDNRSRYNVQSGVSWVFNTGSAAATNLKEIRRKYLQIPEPGVSVVGPHSGKLVFHP